MNDHLSQFDIVLNEELHVIDKICITQNPVEFAKTNQQMDVENLESIDKVLIATKRAAQHTTRNVLRNNIGIKSEIGTTTNSPTSCLKRQFLARIT